jgi:hypothetical protein
MYVANDTRYTYELTVTDSQLRSITSTIGHVYIFILPPDDGLLIRSKHVEA